MADHLMMPMNHGSAGASLHGYRMGMNGLQAGHPPHGQQTSAMRAMPGSQMMHYGGAQAGMEMRQRQGMVPPGGPMGGQMNGAQMGHHHQMMYNGQQHHMHQAQQQQQQHQVQQQQHQAQQSQFMNGGLTSQQLMASMQLQKLNTQYHGHPLGPMGGGGGGGVGHMGGPANQYRMNPAQLANMQHMAGPALALNGMDADMIDEETLTSLVVELGLDRVQELPELFLGQNEFDFISDFVSKQQPSTVSC
ncbi:cbp/p300-interacting transactivator 4b [Corythoichthys intestinalis]|uniref:cbp/p300-interacting transactivator 4b n=1 Tax=Corythoichthys intestinalis TaxID=161448 RepID=UPI0025A56125|nr:cbp/p300-interacting transactivator 4b [Corythoichthys intestinalis]XP_061789844.1 cbp/p300-interacting transactivator 3-like [Nerophis lumbriciformis]